MRAPQAHTKAGLTFVMVCVAIALLLYVLMRPASRPPSTVVTNTAPSTDNQGANGDSGSDIAPSKAIGDSNTPIVTPTENSQPVDASDDFASLGVVIGQDYTNARTILLARHFNPVVESGNCGVDPDSHASCSSPEISDCSADGYCGAKWEKAGVLSTILMRDGAIYSISYDPR